MPPKPYTPTTVTELKRHVADIVGMELEEVSDTKLSKLTGLKRGRIIGWAGNTSGTIPPVARSDVRKALAKLRAKHEDDADSTEPADDPRDQHSYVARGFYFTGAEFLKLDPDIQKRVLAIVEEGRIREVEEE